MLDQGDEVSAFAAPPATLADGQGAPRGGAPSPSGTEFTWTIIIGVAIGTVIAVPHLLDLFGVTAIYSSAADGSSVGRAIIRIFDAIYVLLAVGIVIRRNVPRLGFVVLSVASLLLLANGLDIGEQALPDSLAAIVLQLAPTVLLVAPRVAGTFY